MGIPYSKKVEIYPPSRQITTSYGPIEGRRLIYEGKKQVDAFQGIPYAAPPVGNLRFSLPQPHQPWTELRHTKQFGARGIQKDHFMQSNFAPQSEDNLTLNIFTPVWNPDNKSGFPVLFYIHGGGFVSDSAIKYGDMSICQHLVTKGVIVVTIQYRLGFLGFWTTGDSQIPDNLAFHDMTFALKWIKDNIGKFNGDPENITLMGQSAGGAAVDFLSISPISRDLFHKVIPMAGNANCSWSLHNKPLAACRAKSQELGIADEEDSKEWIRKLRALPAEKFASGLEIMGESTDIQLPIAPKYDKVFLPKPIIELRRESPMKPRLVGCAKYEGLISMLMGINVKNTVHHIQNELELALPEKRFPTIYRELQNEIIAKLLPPNHKFTKEQRYRAIAEAKGDIFLNIGVQQNVLDTLETHSNTPIYMYSFDYFNENSYGVMGWKMPFKGATHCTDISYVVANHILNPYVWTERDLQIIEVTTRLWTNFVKYGDPNGRTEEEKTAMNGIIWKPATEQNPQQNLAIGEKLLMMDEFRDGRPMLIATNVRIVQEEAKF